MIEIGTDSEGKIRFATWRIFLRAGALRPVALARQRLHQLAAQEAHIIPPRRLLIIAE
jgi:low temperature requirement protein LtrA